MGTGWDARVTRCRFMLCCAVVCSATGAVVRSAPVAQLEPDAVRPGEVFVISVADPPGDRIVSAQAGVLDFRPRFYEGIGGYLALGCVPSSTQAGEAKVYVKARLASGGELGDVATLHIRPRAFPEQRIRMSKSKTGLMNSELLRREREKIYKVLDASQGSPYWHGKFIIPARGRDTSSYGRKRYVNGKWWGQHSGADIACGTGTPVHSDAAGIVRLAEALKMRGNTVIVDHGMSLFTLYNHLSRIDVDVGQRLRKGDPVGLVGATGFVTGPHLHWEVRVGRTPVDPFQFTRHSVLMADEPPAPVKTP